MAVALLIALLAALLALAPAARAAEADTALSPAQVAERAAYAQWQRTREQRAVVGQADGLAEWHAAQARLLRSQWQAALEAEAGLATALRAGQDCLDDTRGPAQALEAALQAAEQALLGADAAADALAQAQGAGLRAALSGADRAAAARSRAEQALRQALAAHHAALSACQGLLGQAERSVDAQRRRLDDLAARAASLLASRAELADALQAVAALTPLTDHPLPPLDWRGLPDPGALRRLAEAMPSLPPRAAATAPSALEALRRLARQRVDGLDTLATQTDAAAMLAVLARTPTRGCPRAGCPSFSSEQRALSQRLTRTRVALWTLRADQQQALASLPGVQDVDRAEASALTAALQQAQPWVAPAETEALDGSGLARAALAPVLAAAERAEREAQQAWRVAAAQAGLAQGPTASAMAPAPAPAPRPAPGASPGPDLRSHALAVFQKIGDEPPQFGAYTYVLVTSRSATEDEGVRRRFMRVLTQLQQHTDRASHVGASERPQVHLFCLPSQAREDARADELLDGYLGDVGLAVMRRAQAGVLSKAMAARLASSPGPFLLTLPKRIDESRQDTPLLLADLSRYDEADIADLVASYMKGLVDAFPQRQAEWKPDLPLTVGMTMVRWFSAPGRIVAALVPTASAKPLKSPGR